MIEIINNIDDKINELIDNKVLEVNKKIKEMKEYYKYLFNCI